MGQPVVSIVVPVYNVEKYLERCVRSVLSQTFRDIEVILVDDGSTDHSGKICDQFADEDSRVRVIHKLNGGLSDARNVGAEIIEGRWVVFIDSDDFIEREMISTLYALAIKEKAQIAVCGVRDCYEGSSVTPYPKIEQIVCGGSEALRMALEGDKIPISICDKLISRELISGRSFPKGKVYEDAFYTPKLLLAAEKVVVTTQPMYNYWHRAGSITTEPFTPKKMDIIEAYRYTMKIISEQCSDLIPYAQFRLLWAHFVVLDSILSTEHYQRIPQYPEVVFYLKKNWKQAFICSLFSKGRRISALALRVNVKLYRVLSQIDGWRKKALD
ncbi:MAG: glycosyltransferase [Acutalibacteraceae bacterium]